MTAQDSTSSPGAVSDVPDGAIGEALTSSGAIAAEAVSVNHHCEHWSGVGEDGWPECCICGDNPCGKVTVSLAIAHGIAEVNRERAYYEGEIRYVLEHGKREEFPF